MFSLFTSRRKLIVQSARPPQMVLESFHKHIGDDTLSVRLKSSFTPGGNYVGKFDGRNVEVRYISGMRNSLQPTMHIHVETGVDGGSIILTRYTTSIFVKAFWFFWMGIAVTATVSILVAKRVPGDAFVLLFPLWGLFVLVLMRVIARIDEKRLEKLVRDVAEGNY